METAMVMFEQEIKRINNYLDNATSQDEVSYLKLKRENILLQMTNHKLLEQLTKMDSLKPNVMYCCDDCKDKFENVKSND
jgi:hypothetical protein